MRGRDYEAHRAFSDSAHELERLRAEASRKLSPGCSSDCEWGQPCTCCHSQPWNAPRQPRKPEPRRPHLPLRTRLKIAHLGPYELVLIGLALLAIVGPAVVLWVAP